MIDERTITNLKGNLREYVETITEPDKGDMFKCPLCNSGHSGKPDSDGAFSIAPDGEHWKCFACDKSGDIFDLIGLYENTDAFREQAETAAQYAGISLPEPQALKPGRYHDYIKQATAAAVKPEALAYFNSRGFDDVVIERYRLGYDTQKKAVVIPYDKNGSYYITRSIDSKRYRRPKSDEAGQEPIYNEQALYSSKPCFVCESAFDAISIREASEGTADAIALSGTGCKRLIKKLKEKKPESLLILSFDNDEAGKQATAATAAQLDKLEGISYAIASYSLKGYPESRQKDANDYFIANREQLKQDIDKNIKNAKLGKFNRTNGAAVLSRLITRIKSGKGGRYVSTGYPRLDETLDGGLYPGLYILGALSSLGKTTLALQIADNIAQAGHDVFFYSLEMEAEELAAKSLSRLTFKHCGQIWSDARTIRDIQVSKRHEKYTERQAGILNKAIQEYSSFADNLFIHDGVGSIGIDEIRSDIEQYTTATGRAPVVFVDYLQITGKASEQISDIQKIDNAVIGLKRISRDFETPVFSISNFNRESYMTEVSASSFKGSSSIEYSSDVLLGLQPEGIEPARDKSTSWNNYMKNQECKSSNVRDLELVILKNRNGQTEGKIEFTHHAPYNNFAEKPDKGKIHANKADNIPFSGIVK